MSRVKLSILAGSLLFLSACGGADEATPASTIAGGAGDSPPVAADAQAATGPATAEAAAPAQKLLAPPGWMPPDWDPDAFRGDVYSPSMDLNLDPALVHSLRQEMQLTTPFTLWAVAHDSLIDERFEPVWVWWTALRSCGKGIQMSEDLAGEFGDDARGKAALTTARNELKAFAATQPADITMHFMADLGKWNDGTGNFALVTAVHRNATSIDAREVEHVVDIAGINGAEVLMGSDRDGNWTLSEMRASTSDVTCVTEDRQKFYRFSRQSQWYVVFGEAERGLGGLVNYKSRAQVPAPHMTREQAAAFGQRNPGRKVMVSVTFGPGDPGFVVGVDHSAVRGVLRRFVVTDALDGAVLATRTY